MRQRLVKQGSCKRSDSISNVINTDGGTNPNRPPINSLLNFAGIPGKVTSRNPKAIKFATIMREITGERNQSRSRSKTSTFGKT